MISRVVDNIYIPIKELLIKKSAKPDVFDSLKTLQMINDRHLSISRYGDYEFNLIRGKSVGYQEADQKLIQKLRETLKYKRKQQNHVVGIPMTMVSLEGVTSESARFWRKYFAKNQTWINGYLNFNEQYFDSQISRFWINRNSKEYSLKLLDEWRSIWNGKNVLLVEGEFSRFGAGNDLFQNVRQVKRIICPSKNAFQSYDLILEEVLKNADREDLVLLALGPTATVLAYDLAKEGLWAIDSGNLDMEYEWYLRNKKQKEIIPGKYSIEVDGGTRVSVIRDEKYEEQIIAKLI